MDFEQIIAPITKTEFIDRYKGQEFFIFKDKGNFKEYFTWEKLNSLLASNRFESPRLRLIRDGIVVDHGLYTNSIEKVREGIVHKIDPAKLVQELRKGTAVHILAIDEFSTELGRLCDQISNELVSRVSMTMHVGMHSSKGFDKHWDSHDVLVLQLYGRKNWKVYDFTEKYPYREGVGKKEPGGEKLLWAGDLEEGDVLFLPRGCWHEVQAYEEASMHISIGMFNQKPVDYIKWLVQFLPEFEFFRKDAPIAIGAQEMSHYISEVKERFGQLITEKTYETFLAQNKNKQFTKVFTLPNTDHYEN